MLYFFYLCCWYDITTVWAVLLSDLRIRPHCLFISFDTSLIVCQRHILTIWYRIVNTSIVSYILMFVSKSIERSFVYNKKSIIIEIIMQARINLFVYSIEYIFWSFLHTIKSVMDFIYKIYCKFSSCYFSQTFFFFSFMPEIK